VQPYRIEIERGHNKERLATLRASATRDQSFSVISVPSVVNLPPLGMGSIVDFRDGRRHEEKGRV
jgi:hypothetical protein